MYIPCHGGLLVITKRIGLTGPSFTYLYLEKSAMVE